MSTWTPPLTAFNSVRVTLSPGAHVATVPSTATSAVFIGLIFGERYTASVQTSNGWGFSAPIAAGSATFGPGVAFDRFDSTLTGPDFVDAYLLSIASKVVYGDPAIDPEDAAAVESDIETRLADLGLSDVTYLDEPSTDTQLAIGRRADDIFVTFRGTSSLADYVTDASFASTAFDTDAGEAWAHVGFVSRLESVYDALLADIATLRAAHPAATVVVSGHSLGGALAELAAARLRDDGVPVAVVHTFGAPNVGGVEIDQLFADMGLTAITHRWVNDHDVIPMLLDPVPFYTEVGRTHVFERGVSAPTLDATTEPAGPFGLLDHDLAIYAENLLRQITDTTLLPPAPARLTGPVNTFDTEVLLTWAVGLGARTDADIESFLVENNVTYEDAVALLIALLDQLGYDRLVAILQGTFDPGALAIATSVRSGVSLVDLPALARALLDEFGLDANGLIVVLEGAGFDPTTVAGVVASIFGQGAELLTDGLAALDSQLAQWAAEFELDGDASLLPTDLATLFGLADELEAITLPSLDPGAGIAAAANALADAGWTIDWVIGGVDGLAPPTADDVVQAHATYTIDDLTNLTDPIEPTATGILGGLADSLALQSSGTWDGTLTVDLVVGVDTDGFYLHPDTTFTTQVSGSVAANDDGTVTSVAGGPASVAGTVTTDVTAVASPATTDRVRLGAMPPTSSLTLGGTVGTSLVADLGDVELVWEGTWNIGLDPGGHATVVARIRCDTFWHRRAQCRRAAGDGGPDRKLARRPLAAGRRPVGPADRGWAHRHRRHPRRRARTWLVHGHGDPRRRAADCWFAPINGELGIAWSPTDTTLAGAIRLDGVVAGTVARFDGITLAFATSVAGTSITVVSDAPDPSIPGDPGGSIALFPQGAEQLLLLEHPSGSFTPDGVLTLSAARAVGTIAGEILIEATSVEVRLATPAPNDPQPIVSFGDVSGTVPSLGDLTVTFTGLQLMDDGTFRVVEVTADTADVDDAIGVAGLLPFKITRVSLVFPDPSKLDTFDATVTGRFDLTGLSAALPFTPILHIGDPTTTPPVGDTELTFTVRVDPSKPGVFEPVDLGPITIGFADLEAGPLVLGGTLTLGGYTDGLLVPPTGLSTGEVAASLSAEWVGDGFSGSIDVVASGSLTVDTTTALSLGLTVTVGGTIEGLFSIDALTLGVDLQVSATADLFSLDKFELTESSIGSLTVEVGDLAQLTASDVSITTFNPQIGDDWITVGSAGFEITDPTFRGWGGEAANFGLRVVADARRRPDGRSRAAGGFLGRRQHRGRASDSVPRLVADHDPWRRAHISRHDARRGAHARPAGRHARSRVGHAGLLRHRPDHRRGERARTRSRQAGGLPDAER